MQKDRYPTKTFRLHPETISLFTEMRKNSGKSVNRFLYEILEEYKKNNGTIGVDHTALPTVVQKVTPQSSVISYKKYKTFKTLEQIKTTPADFLVGPEKLLLWWDENINGNLPSTHRTYFIDTVVYERWDVLKEKYRDHFQEFIKHACKEFYEKLIEEKESDRQPFHQHTTLSSFLSENKFSTFLSNFTFQ